MHVFAAAAMRDLRFLRANPHAETRRKLLMTTVFFPCAAFFPYESLVKSSDGARQKPSAFTSGGNLAQGRTPRANPSGETNSKVFSWLDYKHTKEPLGIMLVIL